MPHLVKVTVQQYKPALDVLIVEQESRSRTREQLEATLSVMYSTHTQEPHEKMKTKHQQSSEQRSLPQTHIRHSLSALNY